MLVGQPKKRRWRRLIDTQFCPPSCFALTTTATLRVALTLVSWACRPKSWPNDKARAHFQFGSNSSHLISSRRATQRKRRRAARRQTTPTTTTTQRVTRARKFAVAALIGQRRRCQLKQFVRNWINTRERLRLLEPESSADPAYLFSTANCSSICRQSEQHAPAYAGARRRRSRRRRRRRRLTQ